MANASPQLILTSWLDDVQGPAKLTTRQRELIADFERVQSEESKTKYEQRQQQLSQTDSRNKSASQLGNLLEPKWKPNEIISMFREERQKIIKRGDECKSLLQNVDSVLEDIQKLNKLYMFVSPKTSQLHSECKNIIQERNELKESYDVISTRLNRHEEQRNIFKRMPEIKSQIVAILNSVSQSYQTKIRLDQPAQQELEEYYGRFFIECRRIKELTAQLESCLSGPAPDELLLNLEEIYALYFEVRQQLIEPVLNRTLNSFISKASRNYCDLLRQSGSSLVRMLRNEIQLFYQIFPSSSAHLNESSSSAKPESSSQLNLDSTQSDYLAKRQVLDSFLNSLCRIFYEHLRPVVIHVNHLETLTELFKLLDDSMRFEVPEEAYKNTMSSLAADIQERMVFRTEIFIQDSVIEYKPSSGDLAYPEKLEFISGGELKDFQSMWYPTVQRTVLALFYLNQVFDSVTFRELAQEVVMACFKSLDVAQRLIDERHQGTKIEATLFLSKHLAIIRDQLQSYGIDKVQLESTPVQSNDHSQVEEQSGEEVGGGKLVEIDTSSLESMLSLFFNNEFNAGSTDSLWSQLNSTIVSGTRWTLRAAQMRR